MLNDNKLSITTQSTSAIHDLPPSPAAFTGCPDGATNLDPLRPGHTLFKPHFPTCRPLPVHRSDRCGRSFRRPRRRSASGGFGGFGDSARFGGRRDAWRWAVQAQLPSNHNQIRVADLVPANQIAVVESVPPGDRMQGVATHYPMKSRHDGVRMTLRLPGASATNLRARFGLHLFLGDRSRSIGRAAAQANNE